MKKRLLALPVALLILAVTAFSAFADTETPTATVTITGTPLQVNTSSFSFLQVYLNGRAQTAVSAGPITWEAVDPTGTGNGWHVTISSTDFTTGGDPNRTIDISKQYSQFKIQLLDDDVTVVDGNTKPVSHVTAMTAIPKTVEPPSGYRFLSAGLNAGMGTYEFSPTFELDLPADVYAGTYTATVTVTIVSGPGS